MAALSSDDINKVLDDVCSSSSSSSSTCEKESLNAILEVQYIKDHYDEMEFIDEGGCGAVYKARHRIDMKWYALKFIDIGKEPGKDILLREAKISSSITNENVIKYHTSHLFNLFAEQGLNSKVDTDDDDSSIMFSNSPNSDKKSNTSSKSDDQEQEVLVIQMELCNCNKNLKKVIKDTNSQLFSNQNYRQNIIKGIINGLRCIHDEGIMHRDLKPANIFFDDKDTVKIGDFGFAQHYILKSTAENSDDLPSQGETKHKDFTNKLGTWPYKAPEVDDEKGRYDKRVDIYSLGIILFELYYPMYSGSERATVLTNLRKPTVEFPEDFEHKVGVPHIKQVLQCLLDHDPCKRYPIEILEEILIKTDSKMMVTADIVQQEQGDAPPVMYRQTSKHPSFRRQQNEPSPVCFSDANIVRQQHQQPEICSDDVHQQQPVSTSSEASNIEEQASNATQKMDEELVDHVKNGIANFHLHSGKHMWINDNDDA